MSIKTKFYVGQRVVFFHKSFDTKKLLEAVIGRISLIKYDGKSARYDSESFNNVSEEELCDAYKAHNLLKDIIKNEK